MVLDVGNPNWVSRAEVQVSARAVCLLEVTRENHLHLPQLVNALHPWLSLYHAAIFQACSLLLTLPLRKTLVLLMGSPA